MQKYFASFVCTLGLSLALSQAGHAAPKKDADPKGRLGADPSSPSVKSGEKSVGTSGFDKNFQNLPTNISSDNLVIQNKERVFIYSGNVKVTQGEMTLTSKTLEGLYSEQNEIQRMVAKGDVVITKAELKATGGKALYEAATNTVLLTESPQVEQKGSILTADRIRVFLDDDRSQAEGDVRVTLVKKDGGNDGATVIVKPTPTAAVSPEAPAAPPPAKAVEKEPKDQHSKAPKKSK